MSVCPTNQHPICFKFLLSSLVVVSSSVLLLLLSEQEPISAPNNVQVEGAKASSSSSDNEIFDAKLLSHEDRMLAEKQGYCPVTMLKFLNMNVGGIRVKVGEKEVMVATRSARKDLLKNPEKYIAILDRWEKERSITRRVISALSTFSEIDREIVGRQSVCPVDRVLLGTNGVPIKCTVPPDALDSTTRNRQQIKETFVCCRQCEKMFNKAPKKYTENRGERLRREKFRQNLSLFGIYEAEKSLAFLSPKDRVLAERQIICPVTRLALGTFGRGTPVRVKSDDVCVMVCHEECRQTFQKDPNRYLQDLRDYHFASISQKLPKNQSSECDQSKLPIMELPKSVLPKMDLDRKDFVK